MDKIQIVGVITVAIIIGILQQFQSEIKWPIALVIETTLVVIWFKILTPLFGAFPWLYCTASIMALVGWTLHDQHQMPKAIKITGMILVFTGTAIILFSL